MPFKSKAQARWMFATHPKMAKEWSQSTNGDTFKHLPEHARDLAGTPPLKRASDKSVKTNVEDAHMDLEKFVRSGVLENLIKDLQELDYEGKLKPKMIMLHMQPEDAAAKTDEAAPDDTGDGDMAEMKDMQDMPEPDEGSPEEEASPDEEEEGADGMDPRLMRLIRAKRRGK